MNGLVLKVSVTGVLVLVFFNGWLAGRYLTPAQPITGPPADNIVKYCTNIGNGSIPSSFNQWVPEEYKNGTYALYSCKLK